MSSQSPDAAYALAALLAVPSVGVFAVLGGLVYLVMIGLSLRCRGPEQLFALYRRFPLLNTALGGALFVVIGLQQSTWPFD